MHSNCVKFQRFSDVRDQEGLPAYVSFFYNSAPEIVILKQQLDDQDQQTQYTQHKSNSTQTQPSMDVTCKVKFVFYTLVIYTYQALICTRNESNMG